MNICLYMYILFYILSTNYVCFFDFWTADGDLIVLVYIDVSDVSPEEENTDSCALSLYCDSNNDFVLANASTAYLVIL